MIGALAALVGHYITPVAGIDQPVGADHVEQAAMGAVEFLDQLQGLGVVGTAEKFAFFDCGAEAVGADHGNVIAAVERAQAGAVVTMLTDSGQGGVPGSMPKYCIEA